MSTEKRGLCLEVEESLSEILDGTASARLFDHVADCDACRDLKYEAALAVDRVGSAGSDFRAPSDFAEALIAKIEAARPDGPAGRASSQQGETSSEPRSGQVVTSSGRAASVSRVEAATVVDAHAPTAYAPLSVERTGGDEAATTFDPLAAAKAEEAGEAEGALDGRTTFDPLAAARAEEAEAAPVVADTRPSARDPQKPAGATIPAEPAFVAAASEGGVAASTHHGPITGAARAPVKPEPASSTIAAAPLGATTDVPDEAPAVAEDAPRAARREAIAKTLEDRAAKPAAKPAAGATVAFFKRPVFFVGVAAAMAAAAAGFYFKDRVPSLTGPTATAPWSGSVAKVSRASADKTGGLDVCDSKGACTAVVDGAPLRAGSTLRTDARTRAHLTLADGTALSLDRATEIELDPKVNRTARIKRGTIVADVSHVEGATAHFAFARGDVEVLGTKLAINASDERASVEVARGSVRLKSDRGKSVEVRAGEEATLVGDADPVVASSASLADVMEWSDQKPEDVDAPTLRGLGELRARKPGQTKEKDRAVRLSKHAVKVRIVDVIARTEVDETFTNETDEELEGIFRFPLPPGAQIERLALEVEGKLVEGAFVDRDKGAAIWRGVIQNAAPKSPKPREEIIWVPGPWRDPALLEWQRGGRFELKIFPIPKKGSRRVLLTYTQPVEQAAGIRRFTYPLAHDPSGTTKVDSFDVDLQVLGLDRQVGLTTRGYQLASSGGDGDRRTMHADAFVPAGDLTVEYALPDRDKEVTAWAYSMAPTVAKISSEPPPADPASKTGKPRTEEEKVAAENAAAILRDGSPYVAIALRPRLPRWQEAKERLHVVVVDSSRSMIGERFSRATRLASSIVREMDRRDSFLLLACDTVCKPMVGQEGGSARPEAPGAAASGDVERFLGGIEPDGGSDLSAAMSAARAAAGPLGGKELRVLYLGDGTPSVGPTRPAHLEAAVRSAIPAGDGQVVAVALGADADTTSLQALARGGGGVVVPYVPGQKVSSAALDVLGAAYGVVLRDPEIELPPGLTQVTPAHLDPIRAGGEQIVVARMSGGNEVSGTIKLKGRVAGEKFEQSYPVKMIATSGAGNSFVPRLYAAAKIAELERVGGDAQKPTVIELSKRFSVASRFTSLLVLESEAMFKAFGLDRNGAAPTFTGEDRAESSVAEAEGKADRADEPAADDVSAFGEKAKDKGGFGPQAAATAGPAERKPAKKALDIGDEWGGPRGGSGAAQAPMAPSPPASKPQTINPFEDEAPRQARRSRGRRLVPMRRVFERHVGFDGLNTFVSQNAARLSAAEGTLAASPDSRDKTVGLYALYATSGRIGEAQELTSKWSGRDALDPDALIARSDLAARQGDRERAVRILGGLADVRPADRAIQARLADLHDAAGNAALACEHRIAAADLAPSEAKVVAQAVRCARNQGMIDLASALLADAGEKNRAAVDKLLAAAAPEASKLLAGDVQISADWSGGSDVDLAIIDAQGKRTSWLGSASKASVTARDATSSRNETLAVSNLPQGSYVIEVSRAAGRDSGDPIRGEVTLRLGGEVRKVAFNLTSARAEVGTVKVFFTSRLVPVGGIGVGGWD